MPDGNSERIWVGIPDGLLPELSNSKGSEFDVLPACKFRYIQLHIQKSGKCNASIVHVRASTPPHSASFQRSKEPGNVCGSIFWSALNSGR